jgi:hypothetical protein
MAAPKRSGIPEVEQLKNDDAFRQILELDFENMIPFVIANIRKPGLYSRVYLILNMITLFTLGLLIVYGFLQGWLSWQKLIKHVIAGVAAGSLLVIPVHELFHGLAYRILGAKKIKFGADLHQLIFYVTADRYPINRRDLHFLALLPFAAINLITLFSIVLWVPQMSILLGFFLLAHNLMCIGDFAMVNYVRNEAGEVYSFDEIEKKKSYFYKQEIRL